MCFDWKWLPNKTSTEKSHYKILFHLCSIKALIILNTIRHIIVLQSLDTIIAIHFIFLIITFVSKIFFIQFIETAIGSWCNNFEKMGSNKTPGFIIHWIVKQFIEWSNMHSFIVLFYFSNSCFCKQDYFHTIDWMNCFTIRWIVKPVSLLPIFSKIFHEEPTIVSINCMKKILFTKALINKFNEIINECLLLSLRIVIQLYDKMCNADN